MTWEGQTTIMGRTRIETHVSWLQGEAPLATQWPALCNEEQAKHNRITTSICNSDETLRAEPIWQHILTEREVLQSSLYLAAMPKRVLLLPAVHARFIDVSIFSFTFW